MEGVDGCETEVYADRRLIFIHFIALSGSLPPPPPPPQYSSPLPFIYIDHPIGFSVKSAREEDEKKKTNGTKYISKRLERKCSDCTGKKEKGKGEMKR